MRRRVSPIIAALLAVLGAAGSANASTYAVTRTADDTSSGSLRWAVGQANSHPGADAITLGAGTFTRSLPRVADNVDTNDTGDLDVSGDVTITGAGAASTIIDAAGKDRVFQVTSGAALTLKALTAKGGLVTDSSSGGGGGVFVDGGSLTLDSATISGNEAADGGGGVQTVDADTTHSTLTTLGTTTISGNTTHYRGGGIELRSNAPSSITGTVISGNHAPGDSGGGIAQEQAALTISGSTISGNDARAAGGIEVEGNIHIIDSSVTGNSSDVAGHWPGGGIIFEGAAAPVAAGTPMIERSLVANNLAYNGAGIVSQFAKVTAVNVTISGNQATNYGGGVTSVANGASATVSLVNSTVTGNTAGSGTALARCSDDSCSSLPGSIEVSNSIIDGDCTLTPIDDGHNVESGASCGFASASDRHGVNPALGPLANNGGPTQTFALLQGSPAIDLGDPATCPATDQRGFPRTAATCDAGAYEVVGAVITSGPSGPTGAAAPSFAFHAEQGGTATFSCWLDNGAHAACTSPTALGVLADGEHTFHVEATVNNVTDATPATRTFFVDTHGPSTTITAAAHPGTGYNTGSGFVGPVDITAQGADPAPSSGPVTTRCVVDPPAPPASYGAIPAGGCPSMTSVGSHVAYAASIDPAGNAGPVVQASFTIIGAPDTQLTQAPHGPVNSPPTYVFSSDRAGATFECSYDGNAYVPCTSPYSPAVPADGAHIFHVRAVLAGITDPTSATADVVVDTVPPVAGIEISAGPGGAAAGAGQWAGSASIHATAVDPDPSSGIDLIGCSLDPPVAPTTAEAVRGAACPTQTDVAGDHVVYAVAVDRAGNASAVVSARFQIQPIPDTQIASGPDGATWTTTPTFVFVASVKGATFRCRIDGGAETACASPFTLPRQSLATHTIAVAAVSSAGLVDPSPAARTFVVAKTETHQLHCEVQHWQPAVGGTGDNGCTVEPNGHACSVYAACVGGAPACPVGARCTYKTTTNISLDAVRYSVQDNAWVSPASDLPKVAHAKALSTDQYPVAYALCLSQRSDQSFNGCPASATGSLYGDGTTPLPVCSGHAAPQSVNDSTAYVGTNTRMWCDWTVTIEATPALVPLTDAERFSVYVPAAGKVTAAPAGGTRAQLTSHALRSKKRKVKKSPAPFKATTVTAAAPGPVTFKPVLSAASRATLKKKGKLAIKVKLTFAPLSGPSITSTVTVTLVTPKPITKPKQAHRGK